MRKTCVGLALTLGKSCHLCTFSFPLCKELLVELNEPRHVPHSVDISAYLLPRFIDTHLFIGIGLLS